MNGWIKIHRKITEWEWFNDSKTVHLFLYLLAKANFEPKKWRGVQVERGQLIFGRRQASKDTNISERGIRTCIERLKSTHEIAIKTTNKYSIITICKFEDYQILEKQNDPQNDQQAVKPTTSKRPQLKNIRIEEEINNTFDDFWDAYHKTSGLTKTDRESAYNKWVKLTNTERQKAIEMIPVFIRNSKAGYIKKARTYLSDKNFNDEYQTTNRLAL